MRKVKHITVSVTPELYRQTRTLAAEMDSNVSAMVAHLLQKFPSYLKACSYSVTVPLGAPCHRASSYPNRPQGTYCKGCGRYDEHPTPSPQEKAKSACTPVKPAQVPDLSKTSETPTQAHTAAVPQYADANSNTSKGLTADPKTAYSPCTPVWGKWFRRITTGNK